MIPPLEESISIKPKEYTETFTTVKVSTNKKLYCIRISKSHNYSPSLYSTLRRVKDGKILEESYLGKKKYKVKIEIA